MNHTGHSSCTDETSSSSPSQPQCDDDDELEQFPSFLGDLLEATSAHASVNFEGRERLNSSCLYTSEPAEVFNERQRYVANSFDNIPPNSYDDTIPCNEKESSHEDKDIKLTRSDYPEIDDNIKATEIFLQIHHDATLVATSDKIDIKDYERYLIANSASPNAIYASLLYCLKNDDVQLADTLLRDVGIEYILRHCYLMDFSDLNDFDESDKERNFFTHDVNMFWLASFNGSAQVLDILAEDAVAYFLQNDTDEVVNTVIDDAAIDQRSTCGMEIVMGDAITRAKAMVTDLLDKPETTLGNSPLYTASERNNGDVISVLIKYGANPNTLNKRGNTPALIACTLNNIKAVQALEKSYSVDWNLGNEKGMNPLLASCQCGNLEVIKTLYKYNSKLMCLSKVDFKVQDSEGLSCTALAAKYNRVDVISYLNQIHDPTSSYGVNINQQELQKGESALHVAVRYNHPNVVGAFLESTPCHCDATLRNLLDMTALHVAAGCNFSLVVREFVRCLPVETFALLDVKDKSGKTPHFHAVSNGFFDVTKMLAPVSDLGVICENCDNSNSVRSTPALAAAASRGYVDILITLLHCGAQVDQMDDFGHTSVSLAARHGNLECVKLLVAHGADLTLKSRKGSRTALQKARKYKHLKVVEYLEKHCVR